MNTNMFECKCVYCFSRFRKEELLFKAHDLKSCLTEVTPPPELRNTLHEPPESGAVPEKKLRDSILNDSDLFSDDEQITMDTEDDDDDDTLLMPMGGRSDDGILGMSLDSQGTGVFDKDDYISLEELFVRDMVHYTMAQEHDTSIREEVLAVDNIEIDNKYYQGRINVAKIARYCPVCQKKVISSIGRYPIITIGMIGHQEAGKTVYLTIQDYFLMYSGASNDLSMPGGSLFFESEFSHLDTSGEDIIAASSKNFGFECHFPGNTNAIPVPYCMKVNYRREVDNIQRTACVVCYRDIRGEIFTKEKEEAENRRKAQDYLRKADALLIVTDPTAFSLEAEIGDCITFNTQYSDMKGFMNDLFRDAEGIFSKPSVCMMTKQDILASYVTQQNGKLSRINPDDEQWDNMSDDLKAILNDTMSDSPVFVPSFSMAFRQKKNLFKDLQELSDYTKKCFIRITYGSWWYDLLKNYFGGDLKFIPITAIGSNCAIFNDYLVPKDAVDHLKQTNTQKEQAGENAQCLIPDKAIRESGLKKLKERFLFLPLLYFLERFRIIPPIYDEKSYENVVIKEGIIFKRIKESYEDFRQGAFYEWYNSAVPSADNGE